MSGGIIRYTRYTCPHCHAKLSNASIAIAHNTGKCPLCRGRIKIDARQALLETGESYGTAVVVVTVYAACVWVVVQVTGFNVNAFLKSLPSMVAYLVIAVVAIPGIWLANLAAQRENRRLMRDVKEQLDE